MVSNDKSMLLICKHDGSCDERIQSGIVPFNQTLNIIAYSRCGCIIKGV